LTTPANPSVVSTLPPVISSHLLNNNYLLATQSQAAAAVANFTHPHHPLAPFHHQGAPILQSLPLPIAAKSPVLTQINSIITAPSATIPTQIPNYIATAAAAAQQQQQQIKSINTSSVSVTTSSSQASIVAATTAASTPSNSPVTSTASTPNISMDSNMGQMGQNPMQSHPLSQSMDSVNTASNEEEVS